MPFNNTTDKSGIIQQIEYWTGLGDGAISGDTTLLKIFTAQVNGSFDRVLSRVLSYSDKIRWDDTNHTDLPSGTIAITSGQGNYTITQDDNGLEILNITDVRILTSASATEYTTLEKMTIDDERALDALSPNPSNSGIPTHYLERGNTIFLYPKPNYTNSAGIKLFFEREASYFVYTDTTKEPGIPRPFHAILPRYVALDWLVINKPANTTAITRLEADIAKREKELDDMIAMRYPTKQSTRPAHQNNR